MGKESAVVDVPFVTLSCALGNAFERRHVNDDVLLALTRLEASRRVSVKCSTDIKEQVYSRRQLGLRFARSFLHFRRDPLEALNLWFEVARILDGDMPWLVARTEAHAPAWSVLPWASSAVLLALRLRSSDNDHISICKSLAKQASAYSFLLGGPKVENSCIERSQLRLLKSLVATPSVATWLSIYIERLYESFTIFGGKKKMSSGALTMVALAMAQKSLLTPLYIELSNKQIAIGCIVLALISSRLLPDHFFTQGVSATLRRQNNQRAIIPMVLKEHMEEIEACAASISKSVCASRQVIPVQKG